MLLISGHNAAGFSCRDQPITPEKVLKGTGKLK